VPQALIRWPLALVVLATAACATPASRRLSDVRVVDECRDFAEQTVPSELARGNGAGRSTIYPARDPESLRTLFELCMQAKEALK
jgi:hypothetical protein